MRQRGSPTICYYCRRKGKMIFVPDAQLETKREMLDNGGSWYGPVYACNQTDCTVFYDESPGVLDSQQSEKSIGGS
jgi:hypothetical protein